MNNENMKIGRETTALIEALLISDPNPTTADWKNLIMKNPHLASEIAEFAMSFGRSVHLQPEDMDTALDEELYESTKSNLLNMLASRESPAKFAQSELSVIAGPKSRVVAREIGLGDNVDLLDQIISGETRAPYVLLKRLAERLRLEVAALAQALSLNFSSRPEQVFKTDGKPLIGSEPISWSEAVRAAGLPKTETTRLINLENELE